MSSVVNHPSSPLAAPAVMRILGQFDREKLESTIEVMIALLDVADQPNDPDTPDFHSRSDGLPGDPADHEQGGDEERGAWLEPPEDGSQLLIGTRQTAYFQDDEDAEDDDPAEDDSEDRCAAGDDMVRSGSVVSPAHSRPYYGPGDCEDDELESIEQDVPTLPAVSLDIDPTTGKRTYLGHVNLLTSYRTNGEGLISADTGNRLVSRGWADKPGAPV